MKIVSLGGVGEEGVSHDPAIKKRVMLRDGQVPGLAMFSQARFGPGQVAAAHRHAGMHEVFFVESGQGVIRIDGKSHRLETGVCVVAEQGESHEIENTGLSNLILTYFGIKV